jgi:tetratricopeptide (TPR) repeat protein
MSGNATDFQIELGRLDQAIAGLEGNALSPSIDSESATRCVYLTYQRASLTGKLELFKVVEQSLERAIGALGPASDLYFLKANLDFKFHRLAEVRSDLEAGRGLRDTVHGKALQADLDFQEGRYQKARQGYEAVIREDPTWSNLARLAYLEFKMGDFGAAERLYLEAEDELTAKEMRHYAWVELQRGVMKLRQGQYDKALAYYDRAERAYSGYWLVDDHKAELLGAQERFDEAARLYERVIVQAPRPEFRQALGELYDLMGQGDRAEACYEKALTGYLRSAERGEVHFFHHLTDFYADVREDGAQAVKWARKDIALRRNFSTLAGLAWALYRAGELGEAIDAMNQALSSGAADAHLFFQAAMIYRAGGDEGEAERYLRMAREINPHYRRFHVHR